MSLNPVSFERPLRREPRLSAPYVPGRQDKRFWSEEEQNVI